MIKMNDVEKDLRKALTMFNILLPFTLSDLKKTYRELCLQNHPDRFIAGPGREAANDYMAEINTGFLLLGKCAADDRSEDEMLLLDKETLIARLSKDPFAVYDTCSSCGGKKVVTHTYVSGHDDCSACGAHGYTEKLCKDCYGTGIFLAGVKELSCSICNGSGSFTTRSGKVVPCLKCDGTGVFHVKLKNQYKCRTCAGVGTIVTSCPTCNAIGVVAVTGEKKTVCAACLGVGEVKKDLWNPVIKPGAILAMNICHKNRTKHHRNTSVAAG
jgi:DnaJ-class molecular chaperone